LGDIGYWLLVIGYSLSVIGLKGTESFFYFADAKNIRSGAQRILFANPPGRNNE
jgi:hypothetical protein